MDSIVNLSPVLFQPSVPIMRFPICLVGVALESAEWCQRGLGRHPTTVACLMKDFTARRGGQSFEPMHP